MPRLLLTVVFLDSLKPDPTRQVDYFDTLERGLSLRIAPSGRKTWCFRYLAPGTRRKRRQVYGTFPEVSLAKARRKAHDARSEVQDGKDPAAEAAAWKGADTFKDLADWYVKDYAKKEKRSWAEDDRMIRKELLPEWRDRKAHEISRAEVRALLKRIADRPAPVTANRVLALISRMYTKALENDVPNITSNPALRLPKPGGTETARERVLEDDEIRQLWAVLEEAKTLKRRGKVETVAPISPMVARGLQAVLLTGQRPGEVFGMRWEHLALEDGWQKDDGTPRRGWWTLPASLTKNKVVHRVPLTPRVVEILKGAKALALRPSVWVFAGDAGGSVAARAKKAASELAKAKGEDGEPVLAFGFHRHDLRRTCATNLGKIGIARETISRVLNHVDRGARATAVYQRYEFDAEKRAALEAWERRLDAILTAKPAEVLTFARR